MRHGLTPRHVFVIDLSSSRSIRLIWNAHRERVDSAARRDDYRVPYRHAINLRDSHRAVQRCPHVLDARSDRPDLREEGRVDHEECRGVKPWRMAGSLGAYAVIEAAEGFIDRHEIVPGEAVALRETGRGGGSQAQESLVEPPPALEVAPPSRGRHTTNRHTTLADVVASRIPLAWFESVAIVQELCEAVLKRGPDDDLRIPELKHIELTAEGRVALLAGGPSGHSPCSAPDSCCSRSPREPAADAAQAVCARGSITAAEAALAHRASPGTQFFERPDRQSIVREVFDRTRRPAGAAGAEPAVPPRCSNRPSRSVTIGGGGAGVSGPGPGLSC